MRRSSFTSGGTLLFANCATAIADSLNESASALENLSGKRPLRSPCHRDVLTRQSVLDLLERGGIIDRCQITCIATFSQRLNGPTQHLARARLG